ILQILRTICLKSDNTQRLAPIYALNVLFVPPTPSPDGGLDSIAAPLRNPSPFVHKPNILGRDRIVIVALCDGFDAKA
ncbi:hypothetical protein V8E53_001639, partial [Lactarius tabidus]